MSLNVCYMIMVILCILINFVVFMELKFLFSFVVMTDNGKESPKKGTAKRLFDEERPSNGEDQNKRPRGPLDCLNWSDSDDEEFTPYTQANPSPVSSPVAPIVFAKKSSGKVSKKVNVAKNKKFGNGLSASRKGKSLGELMFLLRSKFVVVQLLIFSLKFSLKSIRINQI